MPKVKQLLLVEDHVQMRDVLKECFEELGFAVDTASSTNEALRMLDRGAYDLVFSDNQFPRFPDSRETSPNQGLELLQWARFEQKYEHTPFILHTADDSPTLKDKVRSLRGIFCAKGASNNFEQILQNALLEHA